MTTKPKHTTTRVRHGASNRLNHRLSEQDRLTKELRDALNGLDAVHIPSKAQSAYLGISQGLVAGGSPTSHKERLVVVFTVREGNSGLPRRWEFVAPPGTWTCTAEHDARIAARKQGLVIHAHIDTRTELRA